MRMLSKYNKQDKVFKLNKALYGLRQSSLLQQQKLTDELKKLGLKKILYEPYVMQKEGIICFFYMDNIIFVFKKDQYDKVEKTVAFLSKALISEKKRELKQFLELYIIRNSLKKALCLLQKAYIIKICNNLISSTSISQFSATQIEILEFFAVSNNEDITNASQTLYKQKVGLFFFVAITIQPNIAFAVLWLL